LQGLLHELHVSLIVDSLKFSEMIETGAFHPAGAAMQRTTPWSSILGKRRIIALVTRSKDRLCNQAHRSLSSACSMTTLATLLLR
jgi:hypothetical protein